MSLLQQLLSEENHNSRFVYLINGIGSVFCVVALVLSTIWLGMRGRAGDEKFIDGFIWFAGVVLSGGVGLNAGGRWLTTKKSIPTPPVESSETTTTRFEKKVSAKETKPKV